MRHLRFSATGAVFHAGSKRVKRTWRRTFLNLLGLLALSALAGWLLHCVRDAAVGCGGVFLNRLKAGLQCPEVGLIAAREGCLLALAPVSEGLLVGAGALVLVGGLFCVGLMLKRWDDARLRWGVVEEDPDFGTAVGFERRWGLTIPEPPQGGTTMLEEEPLALPAVGMTRDDLVRIVAAMIAEATEARGLIDAEIDGLGVEAWEERLVRARKGVHGVILCLGNLAGRITEPCEAAVLPDRLKAGLQYDEPDRVKAEMGGSGS